MSDLLLLGRTTIEEARSLLYWLETAEGYKKLGICGLSMGMWAFTFCPIDSLSRCGSILSLLLYIGTRVSMPSIYSCKIYISESCRLQFDV